MAALIKVCMKLKVLQKVSCILMQLPDSKNKLKEFDIRIVSSPKFSHISCFMSCIFLKFISWILYYYQRVSGFR